MKNAGPALHAPNRLKCVEKCTLPHHSRRRQQEPPSTSEGYANSSGRLYGWPDLMGTLILILMAVATKLRTIAFPQADWPSITLCRARSFAVCKPLPGKCLNQSRGDHEYDD